MKMTPPHIPPLKPPSYIHTYTYTFIHIVHHQNWSYYRCSFNLSYARERTEFEQFETEICGPNIHTIINNNQKLSELLCFIEYDLVARRAQMTNPKRLYSFIHSFMFPPLPTFHCGRKSKSQNSIFVQFTLAHS